MFSKILIYLSTIIDFSSLCIEFISISLSCNHDFIDLLWNSLPFPTHICFGLWLEFLKTLVTAIPVLSYKEIIHAYLLQISITHNKKRIPSLNLLFNCIFERSSTQTCYLKDDHTFCFTNPLIIVLCNLSTNCWFDVISLLKPLPEDFLSKIYQPTKQIRVNIHHILDCLEHQMF